MKPDQERVHCLLVDTISLLCRNGLNFENEVRVQAVIGVTIDKQECFIVHINKCFERLEEEQCENEEQPSESAQQIAETASATQPASEAAPPSVPTIQTTTQEQLVSVSKLFPVVSEQITRQEEPQVSASNAAPVESVAQPEVQVAKSGSVKPETVDDCAELDASRTRAKMRRKQPPVESDECDDSSEITTDSLMCQQRSMTGEMHGKQRAVNRHGTPQPYYKSSQPTRHRPRYSVDAYQPKTKKRDMCEDLFDTEDDSCDDFNVGQQYMYIDAGNLRSRPKKQQQQCEVFFDPCHNLSMSASRGHVRLVFIHYC